MAAQWRFRSQSGQKIQARFSKNLQNEKLTFKEQVYTHLLSSKYVATGFGWTNTVFDCTNITGHGLFGFFCINLAGKYKHHLAQPCDLITWCLFMLWTGKYFLNIPESRYPQSLTHTHSLLIGSLLKCGFILPTQEFTLAKVIQEFFPSSFLSSPSLFSAVSGLLHGTVFSQQPRTATGQEKWQEPVRVEKICYCHCYFWAHHLERWHPAGPAQSVKEAWKRRAPQGSALW